MIEKGAQGSEWPRHTAQSIRSALFRGLRLSALYTIQQDTRAINALCSLNYRKNREGCQSGGGLKCYNLHTHNANSAPPRAASTTTNQGGHFQNINSPKAASPSPKSAGDVIALVQTGV